MSGRGKLLSLLIIGEFLMVLSAGMSFIFVPSGVADFYILSYELALVYNLFAALLGIIAYVGLWKMQKWGGHLYIFQSFTLIFLDSLLTVKPLNALRANALLFSVLYTSLMFIALARRWRYFK